MAMQQNNNRNDRKKKSRCMSCYLELDADHTGIICVQDHHICKECSKHFINGILEEPEAKIPVKCAQGKCGKEVVINTFERNLTHEQAQMFVLYNMQFNPKSLLLADEEVVSCPFCPYFEINTKDAGRLLFMCKKEACLKSSCIWCKKLIKNKDSKSEDKKYDMDESEVEKHFECAQIAPIKVIWDEAIESGLVGKCPSCGLSGQKDGACTHMTCPKCRQKWCYCCGLEFEKVDKRQGYNSWGGHNSNWKKNPKRCPMYLGYIRQIDNRWPSDSDECVTFFHKLKGMASLKKAITEMGDENYKLLCASYDVDKNCGYDMEEVMKGDHTIIKRPVIDYQDKEDNDIIYDVDENGNQECFQ